MDYKLQSMILATHPQLYILAKEEDLTINSNHSYPIGTRRPHL